MSNEDPYRSLGVSSSVVSSLNDNNNIEDDFIDTDDFELLLSQTSTHDLMNSFINNPTNSQFSQSATGNGVSYLDSNTFGSFDQPTHVNNNYSNTSHNQPQQHSLYSTSTASQQQQQQVGNSAHPFDSQQGSSTTSLLDEGSANNFNIASHHHQQQQQHENPNDFYYKEIDQALSDYDSSLGLQVSNVHHHQQAQQQQRNNIINNNNANNTVVGAQHSNIINNNNNNGVISFGPLGHQVIGNLQTNFVVKQENHLVGTNNNGNNNNGQLVMLPIQGFDQQQQQNNNMNNININNNNGFNNAAANMMVNHQQATNYHQPQQLVGFNNAANNTASNNSVDMLMMMQSMNQLSIQQQLQQQNMMVNTQQHNMAISTNNNNMISTPNSGNNSPTTFINPFQNMSMSVGTPQSPSMVVNNQFPVKKVENNLIRMAGRQKRSNSTSSVMSIDSTQSGSINLQKHIHVRSSSNNSNLMGGGNIMFNNNGGSGSGNNSPNTNTTMVNFPNNNQIMFNGATTNNQMMNNNGIVIQQQQQQQFNRGNGVGNLYTMSEPSSPVMGMMIPSPSMSNSSSPNTFNNTAYGSPTTSYISNAMSTASSTRSNSRSRSGSANVLIGKQMAASNKRTNSLQFHTYSCDDEGNVKQNATVVSPNIAKITNVENRKKRSQSDGNIQVAFEKQARKKSSPIASMSPQTNDTMQNMQQPMQMQNMEQSSGNFTFIDATNTGELSLQQQQALFSKKNYMPQYVLRHNIYDEYKFKSKNPNQKYYKFFANQ
ncbi:hypothetical protein NAEGRDRAFT_81344 [Naegleria gruberi]|uniref:Uncharacterized protein n=1 Tax=Naegleria gruberi TaxID=5762 RepID=D2VV83_NAEGR|nr:uncharacterized protein NAEGRDRAFT_81344 [Naegleria gruberi]EFC39265.1 hypothetical protein NAEGRDRAFT_81344 [Naegleria gruberi]|eukprot:XP_002672009.1 hypothetical protein NAEGRDRAFT_81344 [Naegleria gruberi strain NEG-M]